MFEWCAKVSESAFGIVRVLYWPGIRNCARLSCAWRTPRADRRLPRRAVSLGYFAGSLVLASRCIALATGAGGTAFGATARQKACMFLPTKNCGSELSSFHPAPIS